MRPERAKTGRTGDKPIESKMAKEELLEFSGTVTEKLPDTMFRVKLEDNEEIIATLKGKLRRLRFRLMVGDRVNVEMTRYDTTKGRINYWHR